jgi:hypothetical protein
MNHDFQDCAVAIRKEFSIAPESIQSAEHGRVAPGTELGAGNQRGIAERRSTGSALKSLDDVGEDGAGTPDHTLLDAIDKARADDQTRGPERGRDLL